jgi:hypothetical protein
VADDLDRKPIAGVADAERVSSPSHPIIYPSALAQAERTRQGDVPVGVALTATAVPRWTHLSLMEGVPRPDRAGARRCRGRSEPGRATRDEAPPRPGHVARVYQRRCSQDRCCLDKGA